MRYLHTMVRVTEIEKSLAFYCGLLGMEEIRRIENKAGRFTLIFLAAPGDRRVPDGRAERRGRWVAVTDALPILAEGLGQTPQRIAVLATLLFLVLVIELVRRRRLVERYALLWLGTGLVLLVLSLWRGGLNTIADWLGVESYPPAILFAAAVLFVIVVLLHYSTVLSKLTDDNVRLAQEVGLLRERIRAHDELLREPSRPEDENEASR